MDDDICTTHLGAGNVRCDVEGGGTPWRKEP